jgi:predicted GH43/DUF377 family glycosyl hydrolase
VAGSRLRRSNRALTKVILGKLAPLTEPMAEDAGRAASSKHDASATVPICLCMIVRDESAVIERCLESVRSLIDAWVICDTGSSDRTPMLIERLLADIPGRVFRRPWRDFGANRTELLELVGPREGFLLLLDADMTVRQHAPLAALDADAYLVGHDGELDYAVPRLIRADRSWRYEGATHEYLVIPGDCSVSRLDALTVIHHADGGARADKLERDLVLLRDALRLDPGQPRATFYLAQTLRDAGETEQALELYRRRASMDTGEEAFYAAFQAGALMAGRDDDGAFAQLIGAWEMRTSRAEPLYELARLARFRGWYEMALTVTRRALEIPYPGDVLFVHRGVYEWGLRFELAVSSYWTEHFDEALAVIDALLEEVRLPSDIEQAVRANRSYCLRRLGRSEREHHAGPPLAELVSSFAHAEIRLDVSPAWPEFNPTIARDGDGFRLIVRTANYLADGGGYRSLTDEPVIRTLNYLVTLDGELSLTDVAPLVTGPDVEPAWPGAVVGFEDCRLVQVDGCWLALATVRDRNPQARCEVALLELDGHEVTRVTVLAGPHAGRHEKNWMPFAAPTGQLGIVYSCDPTVVLHCDPATGEVHQVSAWPAPPVLADCRGGSQAIALDEGWLLLAHEVCDAEGQRSYRHRFVLLDKEYRAAAASRPFHFLQPGVEFAAGLARADGRLLLTFGSADRRAVLGVLDLEEALELLEPLAPLSAEAYDLSAARHHQPASNG